MPKVREERPVARHRIHMDEAHELRYWTSSFGVDERTLRRTVAVVGNSVATVRKYLKDGKHRS